MKATELRLGNIVKSLNQKVPFCFIDQIKEGRIRGVSGDDELHALSTWNDGSIQLQPIPVTEEWLVKLGLTTAHYSDSKNPRYELPGYGYELRLGDDGEHGVYFEGNCMTYIKFVHQLQNLVFALTGEELTIKEPAV